MDPPARAFADGLPSEGVLGTLTGGPDRLDPARFSTHPEFVRLVVRVMIEHMPRIRGLAAEIRRQRDGWVYVTDLRVASRTASIPPRDILAAIEIRDANMVRCTGNPNYQAFEDGFPRLDAQLLGCLLEELGVSGS